MNRHMRRALMELVLTFLLLAVLVMGSLFFAACDNPPLAPATCRVTVDTLPNGVIVRIEYPTPMGTTCPPVQK